MERGAWSGEPGAGSEEHGAWPGGIGFAFHGPRSGEHALQLVSVGR